MVSLKTTPKHFFRRYSSFGENIFFRIEIKVERKLLIDSPESNIN